MLLGLEKYDVLQYLKTSTILISIEAMFFFSTRRTVFNDRHMPNLHMNSTLTLSRYSTIRSLFFSTKELIFQKKICNREAIDQININISLRHNISKVHS